MKLAGLLLLVVTAGAAGFYGASLARRELAQTSALLAFFRFLRAHVEEKIPLHLLFLQYGESREDSGIYRDTTLESCGFLPSLREGRRLSEALRCCDAIGKPTVRIFEELEKALREERSEELLRRFPVWEEALSSLVKKLEGSIGGKQKASLTLGLCAGALLAILLW